MLIKVRAWNSVTKEMFSAEEMAVDQMALLPTGNFANINSDDTSLSVIYPIDVMIPMFYTGIKDRKNKQVYESDIVETNNGRFEVYYRENYASFYIRKPDGWIDFLVSGLGNTKWIEVVGDIYRNPELLQK